MWALKNLVPIREVTTTKLVLGTDGNKRVPSLVRLVWVTYPGKNSLSDKLGKRKKLLIHVLSKVIGKASMPHGTGLGLCKSGTSRKATQGPLPLRRPGWRRTSWTLQGLILLNVLFCFAHFLFPLSTLPSYFFLSLYLKFTLK